MVTKNKMVWKKSSPSKDFKFFESRLKDLFNNGLYASQNAFFRNDVYTYVLSMESASGIEYAKRNVVLDVLYSAKKFAPGTEILLTDMIVSKKKYKSIKLERVSSEEARILTLEHVKSNKVKNIFTNIVELMGTTGRIHVTEEPLIETEITLNTGCEINVAADHRFASSVNIKNIKFDFINVCIIEGATASVSEINKLLTYCYNNKTVLMLLARSFPEEVINTLAVNWNNKKLRIIPYVYGNDVSNINAHADLASVSGAIPISPMKGDSLNADLTEKFGHLLEFVNREKSVTAKPTTNPRRLVNSLKAKLKDVDWSNHDMSQLLSERISGLSDKTLYVKIAKSIESWREKSELDMAMAMYSGYCTKTIVVSRDGKTTKFPYSIYKKAEELQNVYRETKENIGGYIVYSDKKNLNNRQ
jgi:hypothetical protein